MVFIVLVEPTLHLQFHIMGVKAHQKRDVIATFLAGCHARVSKIINSSGTARETLLALVIHALANGAMVLVEYFFISGCGIFLPQNVVKRLGLIFYL